MKRIPVSILILISFCILSVPLSFAESSGKLSLIQTFPKEQLRRVIAVDVSPCGKHIYTAAFAPGSLSVFQFNENNLTGIQSLTSTFDQKNPRDLKQYKYFGAACLRISPNGKFAVAACFRNEGKVILYKRNVQTGELTESDLFTQQGQENNTLDWAIDVAFSPCSRFVYAIAAKSANVAGFRITEEGKWNHFEDQKGKDQCFLNARGIAMSPDGLYLYIVSNMNDTLVTLKRDTSTGKTTLHQILSKKDNQLECLNGGFGVGVSSCGKHIYVSSGNHKHTGAVGVFERKEDGTLQCIQEIIHSESNPLDFKGGNEIVVSKDGKNVYAAATESNSLACFARDPGSGKLTHVQTLSNQKTKGLDLIAGIAISPDDAYVITTSEKDGALTFFKR